MIIAAYAGCGKSTFANEVWDSIDMAVVPYKYEIKAEPCSEDIEINKATFEECDNAEQRERRRNFYLKNGFHETGWFTRINGTEFIIASSKEDFDKDAFVKFMSDMTASLGAPLLELYRRD